MNRPLVSVIIPAFNSERMIRECLESVLRSDYPNLEIVVVDDGSTDSTGVIVNSFHQVKLLRKANSGSAATKNLGARHATGHYLYFLDSDVVISENTISQFVETAKSYEVDLVVGRYSTEPLNHNAIHHYKALADYILYIPKKSRNQVMINHQIGGGGDFFTAHSFQRLGGFSEEFKGASVEREELYLRFYDAGFKSAANPLITTRHYFPDLKRLVKNYVSRIPLTIKLLKGRKKNHFSYISTEKSVLAPSCALLSVITGLASALGATSPLFCASFGILHLILSREFVMESLKRKGIIMTGEMLILHWIMCVVIATVGLASPFILARAGALRHEARSGT